MTWKPMRAVVMLSLCASTIGLDGCSGGCYDVASAVTESPASDCLMLYAGTTATDSTVCGDALLQGQNACAVSLVLPPSSAGGSSVTVAPAGMLVYRPDKQYITVGNGMTSYDIPATLGTSTIDILFTTRPK